MIQLKFINNFAVCQSCLKNKDLCNKFLKLKPRNQLKKSLIQSPQCYQPKRLELLKIRTRITITIRKRKQKILRMKIKMSINSRKKANSSWKEFWISYSRNKKSCRRLQDRLKLSKKQSCVNKKSNFSNEKYLNFQPFENA